MNLPGAPLRFLLLVAGLWAGVRIGANSRDANIVPGIVMPHVTGRLFRTEAAAKTPLPDIAAIRAPISPGIRSSAIPDMNVPPRSQDTSSEGIATDPAIAVVPKPLAPQVVQTSWLLPAMIDPPAASAQASRWSGSAWLLIRNGASAAAIATNGQLSGSQLGGRLRWRINPAPPIRTAVAVTLSSPLSDRRAAEAAIGAEWYPLPGEALWLGFERRIALGKRGRDGWSGKLAGGFWRTGLPLGLIADGYGQTGFVGLRSRDAFVDGTARLSYPIGGEDGLRSGFALWGAAQPRVARIDIGPHLTVPVAIARTRLLVSLEGRLRIAGHAAPDSGIALTVGTDF